MSDMESGTPPEKDGTSPSRDGYTMATMLHHIQVNAMLNAISMNGQSIGKYTKYVDMEGHDSGDEDPNAWA